MKFESVALEQESQGQSAAVEKKKKGVKTLYLYVFLLFANGVDLLN